MVERSLRMHYVCSFLPPEYQRGEKGLTSQWRSLTSTTSARWSKSINSDEGRRQSFLPGILQARILEWICHSLLQRNFPTQELNPGFLHGRQILYCLSYREVYPQYDVLRKALPLPPYSPKPQIPA